MPEAPDPRLYRDLVRAALAEDVGAGDLTTAAIVPPSTEAWAIIVTRVPCTVAGLPIARETFLQVDPGLEVDLRCRDGDACPDGAVIAGVHGRAAAILTAERTALNFLQHLSGIATATRRFVDAASGRVAILDTRKTIPTLRALAKYAVRCGGGENHRNGLDDGLLIKDNHIRIAGGIAAAVARVRERHPGLPVEVETQSLDDVDAALEAGADTIMLDNLDDAALAEAVARIASRARVEVSGGIQIERLSALRALGVDCVSVGALTHSAPAVDISLDMVAGPTRQGAT